jgi:hypothetical protein
VTRLSFDDHELRAAVDEARAAGARGWPVAVMLGDVPLGVFAEVFQAVGQGLADAGLEAVLYERTGAGVIWVRPTSDRQGT